MIAATSATPNIQIEVVIGDITDERTDAIVNAANEALVRGGGVCGAIFAKAGPELDVACAAIGGCPTGQARMTPGFGLPVRGIIHAVGPRYGYEQGREAELLGSAWRASLDIADAQGFRSIAFPSISTGIYGYPVEEAASIVASTLRAYVENRRTCPGTIERIRIVVRDDDTKGAYDQASSNVPR